MNALSFFSELIARLKTEKPDFFVKIQWGSGIVATLCLAVIGLNYIEVIETNKLLTLAQSIVWTAAGIFLTGQLPTKDKTDESNN